MDSSALAWPSHLGFKVQEFKLQKFKMTSSERALPFTFWGLNSLK